MLADRYLLLSASFQATVGEIIMMLPLMKIRIILMATATSFQATVGEMMIMMMMVMIIMVMANAVTAWLLL